MRYRDLIDDETFMRERDLLQNKITQLKTRLRETESRAEKWLELSERTFNFATYARKAFITGDLKTKKEILMALGQNPRIKNGKLSLQANEWLQEIQKGYPALEKEYQRLETPGSIMNKAKADALVALRLRWWARLDLNQRPTPYEGAALTRLSYWPRR